MERLRTIVDPVTSAKIVDAGMVKDVKLGPADGEASFTLELPTGAYPGWQAMRQEASDAVASLPWLAEAAVEVRARPPVAAGKQPPNLQRVGCVLAVSSCKGGVGKSTVAVNLAYALAQAGGRVGIFDADVYGPSLPQMIDAGDGKVSSPDGGKTIIPIEYEGVACMSYGFVGGGKAAIARGPMVANTITQLVTGTAWGELDYLVLDMPPGTGDVQLTLCQQLTINAAVIVSTPQRLAFIDVVKGAEMFEELKVPVVGIVDNMAYFDCDHGERYWPFGKGHYEELQRMPSLAGAPVFTLPMSEQISGSADSGRAIVLQHVAGAARGKDETREARSGQDAADRYREAAAGVVAVVLRLQRSADAMPDVSWNAKRGAVVVRWLRGPRAGCEVSQPAKQLRMSCRCALCVDEMSGEQLLKPEQVSDDITATEMATVGNYAFSVKWSDPAATRRGMAEHESIFPMAAVLKQLDEGLENAETHS